MWTLDSLNYDSLTQVIDRWSGDDERNLENHVKSAILPSLCALRGLTIRAGEEAILEPDSYDHNDTMEEVGDNYGESDDTPPVEVDEEGHEGTYEVGEPPEETDE